MDSMLRAKTTMRDRILGGPPFSAQERRGILDYCEDDVLRALARLDEAPSTDHPLAAARHVARKVSVGDGQGGATRDSDESPLLAQTRKRWTDIRTDLVREMDRFGIYETVDGVAHWRKARFAEFIERNRMAWTRLASGAFDESDEVFRERWGDTRSSARCASFAIRCRSCGSTICRSAMTTRQNRSVMGIWTKTGRNAPSASAYVFGPAKWIRPYIAPPPGLALVHRDFCQQEVRIAAVLSGDSELLAACESGDVYLGIAKQLGFLRDSMYDRRERRPFARCSRPSCWESNTA